MTKIKFGTDGWRAIIAKEYTVENVERVAYATALWLKKTKENPTVVLGHDCRFGGPMFSDTVARVFASQGVKVYLSENVFVSTPMISLGTVHYKADAGVIITASHNPPTYNGYKIKASYGGPATPASIEEVEQLIPDSIQLTLADICAYQEQGLIDYVDLEKLYLLQVEKSFDLDAIRESSLNFAYDAMYGSGQNIMRRLFPDITFLHCEHNPGFDGQAPEPIHANLTELCDVMKESEDIDCALATDGDADRIGLYNKAGKFIDSHHIILLLIHYLVNYKDEKGSVITTFSCTQKIADLCKKLEIPHTITKIGFKYICDLMMIREDKFLTGGEESGGIAITGHIPERDGIWIGLTIWEFMAKTGKSLDDLIAEVYELVGSFAVERYDLKVEEAKKLSIIENCKNGTYSKFGANTVTKTEDLDGYKFHFTDGEWVMIRPSGTEPVLRVYAEAATSERAFAILDAVKAVISA